MTDQEEICTLPDEAEDEAEYDIDPYTLAPEELMDIDLTGIEDYDPDSDSSDDFLRGPERLGIVERAMPISIEDDSKYDSPLTDEKIAESEAFVDSLDTAKITSDFAQLVALADEKAKVTAEKENRDDEIRKFAESLPQSENDPLEEGKPDPAEGSHWGHRERVRQAIRLRGIENMLPYQILEYLLFFCIPLSDTKPLAQKLINKYGSLGRLFAVDYDVLVEEDKLSESTALFITSLPGIFRAAWTSIGPELRVEKISDVLPYVAGLFRGNDEVESMYMLLLDDEHRIVRTHLLDVGSRKSLRVSAREMAAVAIKVNASNAILVHNHPSKNPFPSKQDNASTQLAESLFGNLDISLLDHIVLGGDYAYSYNYRTVFSLKTMRQAPKEELPEEKQN